MAVEYQFRNVKVQKGFFFFFLQIELLAETSVIFVLNILSIFFYSIDIRSQIQMHRVKLCDRLRNAQVHHFDVRGERWRIKAIYTRLHGCMHYPNSIYTHYSFFKHVDCHVNNICWHDSFTFQWGRVNNRCIHLKTFGAWWVFFSYERGVG